MRKRRVPHPCPSAFWRDRVGILNWTAPRNPLLHSLSHRRRTLGDIRISACPAQNPGGRSPTTPNARSSASPALTIGPSSNSRPIRRHAMRHAPRRLERRQRMLRVRRPIAARLRHFDESRPQHQRGMPREIRDRQHLVAHRRHQQQIHLRKHARHFFRDFAPQPVGLHKIDRRQETAPAGKCSATRPAPAL